MVAHWQTHFARNDDVTIFVWFRFPSIFSFFFFSALLFSYIFIFIAKTHTYCRQMCSTLVPTNDEPHTSKVSNAILRPKLISNFRVDCIVCVAVCALCNDNEPNARYCILQSLNLTQIFRRFISYDRYTVRREHSKHTRTVAQCPCTIEA